jgi:hypothetical protein
MLACTLAHLLEPVDSATIKPQRTISKLEALARSLNPGTINPPSASTSVASSSERATIATIMAKCLDQMKDDSEINEGALILNSRTAPSCV